MKVLFVYDGLLRVDNDGNYWASGANEVFRRYLELGDELSVMRRVKPLGNEDKGRLERVSLPNLNIIVTENLMNLRNLIFKKKKVEKIIYQAIRDHDAIIIRLPSANGDLAVKIARKMKKPYLVEVVGCSWDSLFNHSIRGKIIAYPAYLNERKSVFFAPYAVYVTQRFLQDRYPCCGETIGISDVALLPAGEERLEARKKKIVSRSEQKKIILGTLADVSVKYKGQNFVLKALWILRKKGITNLEYQLVGGGDPAYLSSLASRYGITAQVKFLGSMPHKRVFEWLDSIDIYIQPSRQEGLPRALIEAMSRATPCIGSNAGGIQELLGQDAIFHLNHNSAHELADKINWLLNEQEMLEQADINFRKSMEFNSERVNRIRKQFYQKYLDQVRE